MQDIFLKGIQSQYIYIYIYIKDEKSNTFTEKKDEKDIKDFLRTSSKLFLKLRK